MVTSSPSVSQISGSTVTADMIKMGVGQKDRADLQSLGMQGLPDPVPQIGGIKDDGLRGILQMHIVEIGLDHANHIAAYNKICFHILSAALSRWFS